MHSARIRATGEAVSEKDSIHQSPDMEKGRRMDFNRRTFLRGIGTVGAVAGTIAAPAVAEASVAINVRENEELLWLSELLTDNLAERAAAEAEIERIADEWRDRWPLAPEELLGVMVKQRPLDCERWYAERDIAGRVLERDRSTLVKRLTKKQRVERAGQPAAFYVSRSSHVADMLTMLQGRQNPGRTPKTIARYRARTAKAIANTQTELELARQYEAETAHLRENSGMNAAKARLAGAWRNIESVREAISLAEAFTPAGLRMKAKVLRDELNESGFDFSAFAGSAFGRMQRLAFSVADGRA